MNRRKTALAILCTIIIIAMSSTSAFAESQSREEEEFGKTQSFMGLMDNYLSVAKRWVKMVSGRETTIYLAIERIAEIYEEKGEQVKAIPELRKILSKYEDSPTVKNVIRFKIAEIYTESGQAAKALEELNAIIEADQKR